MASVTKKWIREYVEKLSGFGGQVDKDWVLENVKVPKGGFETTLTKIGKEAVEMEDLRKKFQILLPNGLGWADAWGYDNAEENE